MKYVQFADVIGVGLTMMLVIYSIIVLNNPNIITSASFVTIIYILIMVEPKIGGSWKVALYIPIMGLSVVVFAHITQDLIFIIPMIGCAVRASMLVIQGEKQIVK